MSSLLELVGVTVLQSDCSCYSDESLASQEAEGVWADCHGDCWYLSVSDLGYLFDEWLRSFDKDQLQEVLSVDAEGLGWMRRAGSAFVRCDVQELLDLFTLRGDFRLEFSFYKGAELVVRRWSHDEPTGSAVFVVRVSELDTLPEEVL